VTIAITIATMGRLINSFEIKISPSIKRGRRVRS